MKNSPSSPSSASASSSSFSSSAPHGGSRKKSGGKSRNDCVLNNARGPAFKHSIGALAAPGRFFIAGAGMKRGIQHFHA